MNLTAFYQLFDFCQLQSLAVFIRQGFQRILQTPRNTVVRFITCVLSNITWSVENLASSFSLGRSWPDENNLCC